MAGFHHDFLGVLLSLAAIVLAARLGGYVFRKLGQPEVVGEILAGLLLGPSGLGRALPEGMSLVLTGESAFAFRVLSEIGLVLLMFLIGLDFDFGHLKHVGKPATRVAVTGIVTPFALGVLLATALHPSVGGETPIVGFVLFFATALSITAIPVLGRIMVELGILRTPLGTLTITAAAVDDAIGWVLLAAVGSLVGGGFDPIRLVTSLGGLVALILFAWRYLGPFVSGVFNRYHLGQPNVGPVLNLSASSALLVMVLLAAAATSALGVFAILGPFILGVSLSNNRRLATGVIDAWSPLVYGLLLPVFFTYTGLQTDIGGLSEPWHWAACLAVVLTAMAGKLLGCGLAARWSGCTVRDSLGVAVMMNTRALMGLIAVNAGRDLGVVPDAVYSMLVVMAIATTLITTPLLKRLVVDDASAAPAHPSTRQPAPSS